MFNQPYFSIKTYYVYYGILFVNSRGGSGVSGGVNISQRNPNEVLSSSQVTGRFMADRAIKIWDVSICIA